MIFQLWVLVLVGLGYGQSAGEWACMAKGQCKQLQSREKQTRK